MPGKGFAIALDHFTTFGDLLKYLRRRVGLTQRELSIAVGYSDTQISRLEQNERMPDLATLTARFLPALHLEDQPKVAERLLELAATMRREDAPMVGLAPYKGLQYFDESDAELFFGREVLTTQLHARLTEQLESDQRFLAIIGASGSGKSSVIRAGLIPTLRWQQPSSGWPVFILTPTAHPLEALASILTKEIRQSLPARKLVDELQNSADALQKLMKKLAHSANAAHAILIVDQFEELFTLCRSDSEQAAFVENLIAAASQPAGEGMIILVMRADFYAHCARFNSLRRAISQHQEYIGPMTNEELRSAIEEPARRGHWEFESGLVDLLLHDVGADVGNSPEPGALPLLSHALLSTWQRRRGRVMTLSGYTASGGVRGAISETAEAVFYDQLEPEQREVARQIFLRLTELGSETSTADTRRRVSFEELISRPADRETVQEVLQTLADARLITTDQDTAEVAHEALIREWPTLRAWLEEDREGLRLHRRMTEAAQEWEAMGRDPGVLYRGARLAQAMEWAETHPDGLNLQERAFLDASLNLVEQENFEREARRQRELEAAQLLAETERVRLQEQVLSTRRLRQRAIFLAIALVLAGVLAAAALLNWQRAAQANHLANSRELAAAAVNNLQIDPERSVLLALKALEEAETLEARNALHEAIPELHILFNLPAHKGGVPDVGYSPDGKLVATLGAHAEVKIWEASSGNLLHTLEGGEDGFGSSLAFSPDGSTLAVASETQVVLWDVQRWEIKSRLSGHSIGTTVGYNLGVGQISFSPDGGRLAVANMDGAPKVWDLFKHSEMLSLSGERLPAKAIAFSPTGEVLATAGDEGIVTVWEASDGSEVFKLSLGGIIHSLAFSPDASLLAAASEDGRVKVWEAATGDELLKLPRISGLYDIAFLADGTFATAGQDGVARVWDPESGQELLTLAGPSSTVISVAGSPDGNQIATGGYDGRMRIWDAAPGRELLTIPGHTGVIWNGEYSPDGSRLASASVDGSVKVWNSETGELVLSLPAGGAANHWFTGLAYSPDGARLAVGSDDGAITILDSRTGKILSSLVGHTSYVVGLAFNRDGTRLASASWDGGVKVWDLESGDELALFKSQSPSALVSNVVFSPDGATIFAGSAEDRLIYQWDVATEEVVRTFSGEDKEIYGVALSPDGKLLAGGDQDGTIHIWEVDSGENLLTIPGHAGLINRLTFSQDGAYLASAGFDRLAKVWDVRSGNELVSLYGNQSNVFGVSFSPDGKRLATAGADGSIRTYTLELDQLIALARTRVKRSLTVEECRKFFHAETCPDSPN